MTQNRIYVDGIAGVDTQPGTEAQPVKTLSHAAAIAQTVSGTTPGDIIVVGTGIYRECVNLPVNKNLTFYARGMAIIDGESIRYCVSVAQNGVSTPVAALFVNFIMRNGLSNRIVDVTITSGGYLGYTIGTSSPTAIIQVQLYTLSPASLGFVNCCFYNDTSVSGSSVISTTITGGTLTTHTTLTSGGNWSVREMAGGSLAVSYALYNCTLKNIAQVSTCSGPAIYTNTYVYGSTYHQYTARYVVTESLTVRSCLLDVSAASAYYSSSAVSYTSLYGSLLGSLDVYTPTVTATYNAAPGTINADHVVNTTTTPPDYTTATFPDPDLALNYSGANIAYYLGTGYKGSNIGATWYPAFGQWMAYNDLPTALKFLTNWQDPVSGVAWATDTNYPDGATKGPMLQIDDANGNHYEIDTVAQPAATSGALVSPVYKIPIRSGSSGKPRRVSREATEDTTLSAGSKKVIDSTLGDSPRTMQFRASTTVFTQQSSSLGWTDIGFLDDTITTFTTTFYYQLRVIATIAGQ